VVGEDVVESFATEVISGVQREGAIKIVEFPKLGGKPPRISARRWGVWLEVWRDGRAIMRVETPWGTVSAPVKPEEVTIRAVTQ
jgi:hypothetical protein